MRAAGLIVAVFLCSTILRANDHVVLSDDEVDYTSFKTFAVQAAKINADRPELKSPILVQKLSAAIRGELTAKALKESPDRPDLVISGSVSAVDFGIGPFGRASPVGGRGLPVDFTDVTLVIDISRASNGDLVWRGVFHDTESNAGKFSETLTKDAAALLAEFPPKKKK